MNQLQTLFKLQDVARRFEEENNKVNILNEELDKLRTNIKNKKELIEEKKKMITKLESEIRLKNLDLQDNEEKQKKQKELYSRIKHPKEMKKLEKEMEVLKEKQIKTEDELLSLMEQKEILEKEVKELNKVIIEEDEKIAKEVEEKEKILKMALEQLDELKKERDGMINLLDKKLYDDYLKLLREKDGMAIVEIEHDCCTGCYVTLSTDVIDRVKRCKDIVYCENCGRILYWKEE